MNDIMVEYFNALEFGEVQEFGKMTVVPIITDLEDRLEYFTLKEAIELDLLKITEVDDSGSVPELKVINEAEIPVLILDGEELVGAKQNRIVNTSILLREKSETIIPVSCVEEGRWSYKSEHFESSDAIASFRVRNVKSASVKRSVEINGRYSSDQGAVWNEVQALQNRMKVKSPTNAMRDVYEAKDNDLDDYINAFEVIDGQKGLLVFISGEIMGFDVVSRESAYNDLHKKLIKSYALDALIQTEDKEIKEISASKKAKKFIEDIIDCNESKHSSVGYGWDYRFANDSFVGSALLYKNQVIHASFFKGLEIKEDEIGEMARFSQRVNFRI